MLFYDEDSKMVFIAMKVSSCNHGNTKDKPAVMLLMLMDVRDGFVHPE